MLKETWFTCLGELCFMKLLRIGKRVLVKAHLQAFLTFRAEIKCSLSQFKDNPWYIPVRTSRAWIFQKSVSHIQFPGARTRCKSYTKNTQMLGETVQNFIAGVSHPGYDARCTPEPVWTLRQRGLPPGIEPDPLVVQISPVTKPTDLPGSRNCRTR